MANKIRTIFYIFVIVANKIRMRGTFALKSFFICHSGAMAPEIRVKKYSRPMIVFSAYIKCLFANAYFIRGDYVTHSPRMIFAHSPRRSYAFTPNDVIFYHFVIKTSHNHLKWCQMYGKETAPLVTDLQSKCYDSSQWKSILQLFFSFTWSRST